MWLDLWMWCLQVCRLGLKRSKWWTQVETKFYSLENWVLVTHISLHLGPPPDTVSELSAQFLTLKDMYSQSYSWKKIVCDWVSYMKNWQLRCIYGILMLSLEIMIVIHKLFLCQIFWCIGNWRCLTAFLWV